MRNGNYGSLETRNGLMMYNYELCEHGLLVVAPEPQNHEYEYFNGAPTNLYGHGFLYENNFVHGPLEIGPYDHGFLHGNSFEPQLVEPQQPQNHESEILVWDEQNQTWFINLVVTEYQDLRDFRLPSLSFCTLV